MWPNPPPAPISRVMVAVGARQSLENFRIDSREKPRSFPKVMKLTITPIRRAMSAPPITCNALLIALFGADKLSAQLPISINATGRSRVAEVRLKLGRLGFG